MAPDRVPGGFGARLRHARERRGISLRQIASATKISISALEALECDDISRLPGGIFSRAFVRSYAIQVGLEPEAAIQEFIAQFPHDSVTAGHPTSSRRFEANDTAESDRRMASTVLRLLVISIPIAAALLYFGMTSSDVPPPEEEREAPRPAGTTAESPVVRASAPPAEERATDGLTVTLAATGPCWVSAVVDGERVAGRELQGGERQQFEARRDIRLTLGNPAAVSMTLNGDAARRLGAAGRPVTLLLTPGNFREFLVTP
jgi:cytoskeletal protein RodZ